MSRTPTAANWLGWTEGTRADADKFADEAWPCDDYKAPLTCWTTPKPRTMVCQGCRAGFVRGPEVQPLFRSDNSGGGAS